MDNYLNGGIAAIIYRQIDVSVRTSCFFGLLVSIITNAGFSETVAREVLMKILKMLSAKAVRNSVGILKLITII